MQSRTLYCELGGDRVELLRDDDGELAPGICDRKGEPCIECGNSAGCKIHCFRCEFCHAPLCEACDHHACPAMLRRSVPDEIAGTLASEAR